MMERGSFRASGSHFSTLSVSILLLSTELPSLYPVQFSTCPPQWPAPLLAHHRLDGSSTRLSPPRPSQPSRPRQQAARHRQARRLRTAALLGQRPPPSPQPEGAPAQMTPANLPKKSASWLLERSNAESATPGSADRCRASPDRRESG